ncbi:hypothetical protein [Candidatus Formimonas warabiya]|nr:hypothetical protein [Candidatus Formimonas warabiya]
MAISGIILFFYPHYNYINAKYLKKIARYGKMKYTKTAMTVKSRKMGGM